MPDIKLTDKNADRIDALLTNNGRATKHTYSFTDLVTITQEVERRFDSLQITKAKRVGARVACRSGGKVTKSYGYQRVVSFVQMRRGVGGAWFVTTARTADAYPSDSGYALIFPTADALVDIKDRLLAQFTSL